MSQANDSVLVTPGSGATIATELINSKEHQVIVQADSSGHLVGTLPSYIYATPAVAVGASKLYFDLFNAAGSGVVLDVRGVWVIPRTEATVSGLVGIRVDLYRTSAVGTGGTTHSYKSATIDVAGGNISPMDTNNANLPAGVTARWLPTAGATISEWILATYSLGEEAATSMAYMSQYQNLLPELVWGQKFSLREGQGLLAKQGTVASAGTIGFLVAFTVE